MGTLTKPKWTFWGVIYGLLWVLWFIYLWWSLNQPAGIHHGGMHT